MKKIIPLILIITNTCLSQSLPLPKNIQAPTTASLGKYGDVPVSLYNGTTNISIPIATITEKGMNLDISLSYDSSGVGVGSVPGWVGQNWSLNAGGVITRQINGDYPDEYNTLNNAAGYDKGVGYMNPISRDRLNVSNWNDPNTLLDIEQSNNGNINLPNGLIGKDSEPDVFTFNFMGHSGKFFMSEDGQWRVASNENFKVVINESDFIYPFNIANDPSGNFLSKVIGKIILIDDQGNTYTFGGFPSSNTTTNTTIEYSKDFFGQSNIGGNFDKWKASSWYLTKVQDNTGTVLFTLNYVRENGYTGFFYNYQYSSSFKTVLSGGLLVSNCSGSNIGSGFYNNGGAAIGGSLISPVYLTKIIPYSNEYVNFNSTYTQSTFYESATIHDVSNYISNLWSNTMPNPIDQSNFFRDLMPYTSASAIMNKLKYRKLTDISGFCGNADFNYNEPSSPGQHNYRFNLNSVTINGDLYQFEYDRFNQLPRLMSKAVDHLGYYNDSEYPNVINQSTFFNQRATNSDKVLIGSLKKIIYPTKGYTQFEYEPHQYSQYVSDDKQSLLPAANSIIGGIRIKKITTDDLKNNLKIKEYKYVKNYNTNHASLISSGILNNLPKYLWIDWRIQSTPNSPPGYLSEDHFSVNPLISMSNFFGAPIGYGEVVEINGDQSYTINKYTSNEDYKDEAFVTTFNLSPSPYQKYNDKGLLRGKLIESSMYNNTDNIVNKTSNIYSTNDPNLIKYVKGSNVISKACSDNGAGLGYGFLMGNAYKIYYFDNNLINEQNISYLNGQELKTETNYVYQYYPDLNSTFGDCFLKSKITQSYLNIGQYNSVNIQESYDYPFDISSSINTGLVSNRVFVPLQKTIRRNGEVISTDKISYASFPPFVRPESMWHAKGSNPLEQVTIIDNYDIYGNILQYHTKDGIYTTLGWCYENKYPVVKIEGAPITNRSLLDSKIAEVKNLLITNPPQGGPNLVAPIVTKLNEIRDSFPNHQVTTYTYYPGYGSVTSITDPKGNTSYYNYDFSHNAKLINVKDMFGNILSVNEYHYRP